MTHARGLMLAFVAALLGVAAPLTGSAGGWEPAESHGFGHEC